jgi:hypothetical protein
VCTTQLIIVRYEYLSQNVSQYTALKLKTIILVSSLRKWHLLSMRTQQTVFCIGLYTVDSIRCNMCYVYITIFNLHRVGCVWILHVTP